MASPPSGATSGPTPDQSGRPQVLVLGGGFAGIGAARKLKNAEVDVTVVDKNDYHTFQPLLYQVATDLLETAACGHPLRDLFHEQPNVAVHEATVTGIDLAGREVRFAEMPPFTYDYLVLGLGAGVNFFGVEGADKHAFPMYTLADALRLKEHVLRRWEAADRDPALVADGAVNVVVVGGGPTGIESAGALAELYRSNFAQDYPGIPQERARIVLVEAGSALMPMFKSDIRSYTKKALEDRGVEVLLGEVVASIEPTRVTLASGKVIEAHTLVWGAGLQASPIVQLLGVELQHGNRVPAEPDLSVAGHPEAFAVGDIAWITDTKTKDVLPQLGSVALQAGEHAGENIARMVAGKDTEPFEYHDKGTMATIGRGTAVIQTRGGHTLKGKSAFLAWGAVHLALLSTGEDRAKAVVDWTWAGFTHERPGRISVRTDRD
ncbi:MAG TPA: NAD(P)/FAD-dependent oxidoreductase [Acidimicrobiales bacterium]|nr:NAD(P)/FAD-dependent oxidoreductase [Acidimicrobiales bacterium]